MCNGSTCTKQHATPVVTGKENAFGKRTAGLTGLLHSRICGLGFESYLGCWIGIWQRNATLLGTPGAPDNHTYTTAIKLRCERFVIGDMPMEPYQAACCMTPCR